MPGLSVKKEKVKQQRYLIVSILLLAFGFSQDFFHSLKNNHSFYFSESLLFNSFWLLFLPFISSINFFLKVKRKGSELIVLTVLFILVHLLVFSITVTGISAAVYSHTYSFSKTISYGFSNHLLACTLVYGLAVFFMSRQQSTDNKRKDLSGKKLRVSDGQKSILIKSSELIYIKVETPYLKLVTKNGNFLYLSSLKAIQEELDPNCFLRIHKSTIVNIENVASFKSRYNGDYDLTMSNGELLRLSRNYKSAFKEQFI